MKRKDKISPKTSENINEILNQTLKLLETKNINLKSLKNIQSFNQNLKSIKSQNTVLNRVKQILSCWDIIILSILNIIFATYLAFFLTSYFSTDSAKSFNFNTKIDQTSKWLISKWMHFNEFTDLTKEECAVILPDIANSITRPLDDCAMCNNLTQIKRIKNISKQEFLDKYAYSAVPVIITDAITTWSALEVFDFEFFKDLYSNLEEQEYHRRQSKLEVHDGKSSAILQTFNSIVEDDAQRSDSGSKITCQFFPYKTKFKNLNQVFEMELDENGKWLEPWYVGWSNCNSYASKVLRQHYERPYFLPDEAEMSRLDWIFMGTPGNGANMHIDDVNNPSWQAQISGIKHWTFKPPAECLLKCPFSLSTDVHPGDIIIFDSNRWFHSTFIKGEDISLTIGSEYD